MKKNGKTLCIDYTKYSIEVFYNRLVNASDIFITVSWLQTSFKYISPGTPVAIQVCFIAQYTLLTRMFSNLITF